MAISSSVDLRALPAVTFAPLSAADIEASILTTYEGLTGVSLQPGDPVRLFLEALAYVLSVQNRLPTWPGSRACWPMPRARTSTIWARSWAWPASRRSPPA